MSPEMAKAGLDMVMGISAGYLAEANINASNKVNEANAYASNLVRAANNKLSAARGSLNRYTQSVNNNRVLANTGRAAEASIVNYRRNRDSAINDDFESQIALAEQAGAQSAASALSGLTGGVVDIVNSTTALRKARIQQRTQESMRQGDFDASTRQAQILQAGWDSLDHSEVSDAIDYGNDVAVRQAYGGNLFTEIAGSVDMKSVAGFFSKGPYDAFKDRAGAIGSGSD